MEYRDSAYVTQKCPGYHRRGKKGKKVVRKEMCLLSTPPPPLHPTSLTSNPNPHRNHQSHKGSRIQWKEQEVNN